MENTNIEQTSVGKTLSSNRKDTMKLKPIRANYEESVKKANVKVIGVAERQREKGFSDAEINIMRLRDRETIKCVPRNIEYSGRNLQFYFKKYSADSLEYYDLEDGVEVMLPRGVAHHLIDNGSVNTFILQKDQFTGKAFSKLKKIRRFTADGSSLFDDMKAVKEERGF